MRILSRFAGVVAAVFLAGMFSSPGAEGAMSQATIVGAGKGAGAFRMAGAIAETLNKYSKTLNMTNQESGGFVANTRLVAHGRVEFALTNGVFVDQIQTKKHPFDKEAKPATSLRGVGPIAGAWLQIAVLADSNIEKLEDLKGKRVSLGPKGSNSVYMIQVVLETMGVYKSVRKDYLKWTDGAINLVDGKLDAFGIPNPIPSPSVLQAAQSRPIRVLEIPDKVIDKFVSISKGYSKTVEDMSVYQGMKGKKIQTVTYKVYMVAHDKASAGVVYEMAKQYYDPQHREFILSVYKPLRVGLDASKTDKFVSEMKAFGLKLHPGAARYWKERNFNVN